MSRSTSPFVIPASITETVAQIVRGRGGWSGPIGMTMTATPPEPTPPAPPAPPAPAPPAPAPTDPPEGVSKAEWDALGDPGRAAIAREREARKSAEAALAAARARPTPPANPPAPPANPPTPGTPAGPDLEAIVQQAVAAAVKPFSDREEARDAAEAVTRIKTSVATLAKDVFHDTSDAIGGVDLTKVTDGNGGPDTAKITAALDALLKAKPHLGKVPDGRLYAQPGFGGSDATPPLETRVQGILAEMQAAAGIRPPATPGS